MSILRWAGRYCTQTKYVIRSDDDIEINIPKLLSVLERTSELLDNFVIGNKKSY